MFDLANTSRVFSGPPLSSSSSSSKKSLTRSGPPLNSSGHAFLQLECALSAVSRLFVPAVRRLFQLSAAYFQRSAACSWLGVRAKRVLHVDQRRGCHLDSHVPACLAARRFSCIRNLAFVHFFVKSAADVSSFKGPQFCHRMALRARLLAAHHVLQNHADQAYAQTQADAVIDQFQRQPLSPTEDLNFVIS